MAFGTLSTFSETSLRMGRILRALRLHIPVELTTRSWILTRRFRPGAATVHRQLTGFPILQPENLRFAALPLCQRRAPNSCGLGEFRNKSRAWRCFCAPTGQLLQRWASIGCNAGGKCASLDRKSVV